MAVIPNRYLHHGYRWLLSEICTCLINGVERRKLLFDLISIEYFLKEEQNEFINKRKFNQLSNPKSQGILFIILLECNFKED